MAESVRKHLSARQEKAIAALVASKTLEEAAQSDTNISGMIK